MGWELPLAAFLTIVDNCGDEVEDVLADVGRPEAPRHFLLGGVPPPEVQLAQLHHAGPVVIAAQCTQ